MTKDDENGGGYGRPPRKYHYPKGHSGNLKGRPKRSRSVGPLIMEAVSETVYVTENGKRQKITKLQVMIKQLINKAASGDLKSTQVVLSFLQLNEAAKMAPAEFSENDRKVLESIKRRLRKTGKEDGDA